MIHYANLTRGMLCAPSDASITRIQSTHLEQCLMSEVLMSAGPGFYYDLARGEHVKLHDYSEKERLTRAQWAGLPWIQYCLDRLWFRRLTIPVIRPRKPSTQPIAVGNIFNYYFLGLTTPTRRAIVYFKQYLETDGIQLEACDCKMLT